ncbi:MAG TPA: ATP synthase F1 subunit delta [Chitinophagaceae bacterium]|nr:ATP synthase F1 subunit delta [Chitinophagaceae bacterium]HPH31258.1 ATP synthase F1 subunit delta [Chitinophagaceae bacterium]HPN59188.1 ATP synthase F1 subunit delta [Chitinophagaceae bacterium]
MQNPRLASRYAKSILDLAIERGELEKVYADMQWLQAVCKSNRDFVNLLRSPIIKNDTKRKIIEAVTAGNISELTAGFNRLLVAKNRERFLPEIVNAFIAAYKAHHKIRTVQLTTATPVTDSMRSAIVEQVKKSAGFEKVEVEEKVNPELIGGFVLQVGDQLIDASVAYDLRAIAKQFENNDFIYKIR